MAYCLCFGLGRKTNPKDKSDKKSKRDKSSSSSSAKPARASLSSETVQDSEYRCIFSYRQLATATNNFRNESLIGRGGFGTVYKGQIDAGKNIAVKMLDNSGVQGDKEFLVEVLMLSLLHHENLVHLYGYCAEADHRLLVYEYMPLGSVEDHIYDLSEGKEPLDWITRLKIARGAAKGLAYLHDEVQPPVIYRDLKTSNILLDHEYNPKLSDFGLAKFAPTGDMSHVSTRVMGTHGYCAPEYANSGKLTMKSDIYSFGVVLLELITGRKALMDSDECVGSASRYLVHWAQSLYWKGQIEQIVDPMLSRKGGYSHTNLQRTLDLAFMCALEEAKLRLPISEVVKTLDFIIDETTKKRNSRRGRGVDMDKAGTSSSSAWRLNVNEEAGNGPERMTTLAEVMSWAHNGRGSGGQSTEPPTPSP